MKIVISNYSNTIPFSDLAESEPYREEFHGTVYIKLKTPIVSKYGDIYNAVDIATGELEYTFKDADVFPVDGTFVEGYKGG